MPEAVGPKKSCLTCPSYLKSEDVPSKFKKHIGAAVCGRYGIVLDKPGIEPRQAQALARYFAEKCDSYGQPLPPAPKETRLLVTLPDLEAHTKIVDPVKQATCKSCASCVNFVRDDVVARELGWAAGLCAAKGKLILPDRQAYEARGCTFREYGPIRQTTVGLHLLPEYDDAFNLNTDPVKAYFARKDEFVEPHEWPTDKPVSDEDRNSGIRAWRKIEDPDGSGNETYLPCFDPDFFTPEERSKIPRTGDDEHPELYLDHFGGVYFAAVAWSGMDETPTLWGQSGTGKTELFRHLAWLMCLPFERISITGSTELDDLAGKMHYSPEKGTYFSYGRLPKAWVKPCVVCVDEPNVGPPDVWQLLRPLTDNSKQLVLDMNEGERLSRHNDCYLGLAMNPAWDALNIGAHPLGDADANRLLHVFVQLPPPELEAEIIRKRVRLDGWEIDEDRLDAIMAIASEVRDLAKEGTLPITWAIRPQIKVARAMRWFEMVTAYRRAVADYLEPEACDALLDIVRAHAL